MTDESRRGASAARAEQRWSDHQVEQFIGRMLQLGVLVATVVVLAGGALMLAQHGRMPADFGVFQGQPASLSGLVGIVRGAFALDARSVVQLGLVLLIATPVSRVALALVAFVIQRDRLYVAISGLVLALLLYGLIWGRA